MAMLDTAYSILRKIDDKILKVHLRAYEKFPTIVPLINFYFTGSENTLDIIDRENITRFFNRLL